MFFSYAKQEDSITFFKHAHDLSQEGIAITIKTKEVKTAFADAKIHILPEDDEYSQYSLYIAQTRKERFEKGQKDMVRNLFTQGCDIAMIAKAAATPEAQVRCWLEYTLSAIAITISACAL